MKLMFWLAVILLVWWAYRRTRATGTRQTPPPAPAMQEMVACAHCGIHLPHGEAVAGMRSQYCSAAHRSAAGDANPG